MKAFSLGEYWSMAGRMYWTAMPVILACSLSCTRARPPAQTRFLAGPAAHSHGVVAFEVVVANATHLDLVLEGSRAGHLKVETIGGSSTQRLALAGAMPIVLRTSWERVELEANGENRLLAERVGAKWTIRQPVPREALPVGSLLLALDIDLAVQGTSMIFRGRRYAFCTPACVAAERCIGVGTLDPLCAESIATCGACLEQESGP